MTSVEPLIILSAAESPPLNILVMCAHSHFCLVCLNWASVTDHKRNPDRYTPHHGIFHKKQVPAGLLAEWGHWHSHSTHFRPRISGFASCNPHCSWPPPSGKCSCPRALQQATFTLYGSPSLPASLDGTCIHILCSICRAIGQIQHFFRGGDVNFTQRFREDRLLVK